ncbi:54S ribosomal protein L22, mitochondrial [Pseudocyphellaria aurata]|nr:54S ribosomal protein L22, mitochondrial [Pseudocyphellaria aurata]
MSFTNSSQRLVSSAVVNPHFHKSSPILPLLPFFHPSLTTRRTSFLGRIFGRKKEPKKFLDPLSPEFLKRKPVQQEEVPVPRSGDLAPSSIFETPSPQGSPVSTTAISERVRDPATMAAALDPAPHTRMRWQRKMIIRDIRRGHRMSKTVKIARTERFSLSKSQMLKTSVKKLGPLARQIAGKPIEDAIVQMRFSKKKAAVDVKKLLEYARDEATVRKGMGLGHVEPLGEVKREGKVNGSGQKVEFGMQKEKPIMIEDKKGKKRVITDRRSIYIDQAWVGRGKYDKEQECRAAGRANILRPPWTSKSPFYSQNLA